MADLFFVLDDLHASTLIYGLTGTFFAAGQLVGALVNEQRDVDQARLPTNIIVGSLMLSIGILLTGFAWHWALLLFTLPLAGVGSSTLNAYAFALILRRAPDASRGRVSSAVQGVTSIGLLASLAIGGLVVSVIDPRIAILISGAACLVVLGVLSPVLLSASARNQNDDVAPTQIVTDLPLAETE